MKAMIFAAGLGTRLRPLTNDRPKALVEVGGKTLLQHVIERLHRAGVTDIVINVYHFADKVIDFLTENENFGLNIHLSEEKENLLNTGGGLKQAQEYLTGDEPFILHNTDILSDIDIKALYKTAVKEEALVTLAVRQRETSRYLLFSEKEKQLCGWKNVKTGEIKASRSVENTMPLAFSGISVMHPRIFDFMPEEKIFSIIPVWLEAAKQEKIIAYPHDEDFWLDVGKLPAIEKAEAYLNEKQGR